MFDYRSSRGVLWGTHARPAWQGDGGSVHGEEDPTAAQSTPPRPPGWSAVKDWIVEHRDSLEALLASADDPTKATFALQLTEAAYAAVGSGDVEPVVAVLDAWTRHGVFRANGDLDAKIRDAEQRSLAADGGSVDTIAAALGVTPADGTSGASERSPRR